LRALQDGLWNREPLARLATILAEAPADTVVHVHQWTKYFSPSLFSALRASHRPLVLSMHDYFSACPTGLMYRFDRQEPCRLKPLSGACIVAPCDPKSRLHKAVRVGRTLLARIALGDAPLDIVHVSDVGRRTIAALLPAAARHHVITNPIEVPQPRAPRAGIGEKLVYCGRLTPEKGAEIVADVARRSDMPALFIGEGPSAERIRAINPKAEITGWLAPEVVRARIAAEARALAAPSLWPETGPLVVAEAMALGVPVIVSDRAGASSLVRHGETGFITAPEPEAIAAAMMTLADPASAARIGRTAFAAYWSAPCSPARHVEQLVEIYRLAQGA
jgi:glycosyltransferase involved in cell wall biosynthesis